MEAMEKIPLTLALETSTSANEIKGANDSDCLINHANSQFVQSVFGRMETSDPSQPAAQSKSAILRNSTPNFAVWICPS
jgi:hypothetical protein